LNIQNTHLNWYLVTLHVPKLKILKSSYFESLEDIQNNVTKGRKGLLKNDIQQLTTLTEVSDFLLVRVSFVVCVCETCNINSLVICKTLYIFVLSFPTVLCIILCSWFLNLLVGISNDLAKCPSYRFYPALIFNSVEILLLFTKIIITTLAWVIYGAMCVSWTYK
jgi:hypothetical protein